MISPRIFLMRLWLHRKMNIITIMTTIIITIIMNMSMIMSTMTMSTMTMSIMGTNITIIMVIITQMKYSPAGERKLRRNTTRKRSAVSLQFWQMRSRRSTVLFSGQRELSLQKTVPGSTLILFRERRRSDRDHPIIPDGFA